MLLDPGLLLAQSSFSLFLTRCLILRLHLGQVVSKFVVGDDESVGAPRILDAVGVVVVTGRRLHHDALFGHFDQHGHIVGQLRRLHAFQPQQTLLLLLGNLIVVK